MKKTTFLLVTLSLGLSIPSAVYSGDLLDTLYENGTISQEQYRELADQRQQNKINAQRGTTAAEQNVSVNTTGGLGGRSLDGASAFQLRGRLQLDMAFYDGGVFDNEMHGNGSEVRRAFLSVDGRVWNDWEYELEMDFGENEPELVDAFIRYIGGESWDFRVGHIKEPFSLEEQTSNVNLTFMERSLPNAFAPDRNFGVEAGTYGDSWSFVSGIFGEGADDRDAQDEGFALTGRGTYSPILGENSLLHLGASATFRQIADGDTVRIRSRPESHISDIRYTNTGKIEEVDDLSSYGVEFAYFYNSFSVQAEHIATRLNRDDGSPELNFDGNYVFVSWILTGESRSYRDRKGEFGHITPNSIVGMGGKGAWELGLRYSHLNLNDEDIDGGEETNQTLGVNWYATPNIRFMFNVIHVESEQSNGRKNDDVDIFQTRAQLVF